MGPKRLFIVVLFVIMGATTGCWDHRPPETVAFVHMIGIDQNPENSAEMTVTQMVAIPSALASGGVQEGGPGQGTPFYLLSAVGQSLEGAQSRVMDHVSRVPRLDHMVALVLGEDLARAGMGHTISWALRHPEIRPGQWLLVSEGPAQRFLDAAPALDRLPGAAVRMLMEHADRVAVTKPIKIYEFAQTLLTPRQDGYAPLIRRVNPLVSRVPPDFTPRPYAGSSDAESEALDSSIQMIGLALFKGDRMVGKLTGPEASGVVWLAGTSKASVTVPHPTQKQRHIGAFAVKTKTSNTAELRGDTLVLKVHVTTMMDVWEAGVLEPEAVGRHAEAITHALAEEIKADVAQTMQQLQSLRVDIFGFAEQLYRSKPNDWKRIADEWDDKYEKATLEIEVDVHLRRSGVAR